MPVSVVVSVFRSRDGVARELRAAEDRSRPWQLGFPGCPPRLGGESQGGYFNVSSAEGKGPLGPSDFPPYASGNLTERDHGGGRGDQSRSKSGARVCPYLCPPWNSFSTKRCE